MCRACVQNAERLWVSNLGSAVVDGNEELLPADEDGLDIQYPGWSFDCQFSVQIKENQVPFIFGFINSTKGQLAASGLSRWSVDAKDRIGK